MGNATPAVEAVQLGRRFGRRWVMRDLALVVPRGCVFGFLGLNGAGKSTTMRMMMGVLTPHEGTVRTLGADPCAQGVDVKRRVGYVGEKPHFYEWMTVAETMAFVAHYRAERWDHARAEHLLKVFKLPREQKIATLSKGQQAKVSLLLAMAFNPEMLVLDEPTLGLDPVVRREFVESLLSEYMEGENTVFISSHLIDEIAGLVDRVGILHDGKLLCNEPADALRARVRRIRFSFDGDPPARLPLEGIRRERRAGREVVATIDNFDPQRTPALLDAVGASSVAVEELGLENLFIDFVGGGES